MGGAHSSENGWTLRSQDAEIAHGSAALVDPRQGGLTTLSASPRAAGRKRNRTLVFRLPTKDLTTCPAVEVFRLI
ncbi:jg18480 [Pararge aegeria aegeria]|uniref:Jg18480 protein n=1 Tax=Pararge aegeria aegeria TaxID=348720 RepID=A0A8S4RME1_9NEOP|nr:jg18480 [Pararge aegeria aegeria]